MYMQETYGCCVMAGLGFLILVNHTLSSLISVTFLACDYSVTRSDPTTSDLSSMKMQSFSTNTLPHLLVIFGVFK